MPRTRIGMPRRLPAAILPQVRQRQLQYAYGKSHISANVERRLPPPVVPTFPQKVTLSDGSTFTHWTSSPRSVIRLTRDISNSPLWTLSSVRSGQEDDASGRISRFRSKYSQTTDFDDFSQFSSSGDSPPSLVFSRFSLCCLYANLHPKEEKIMSAVLRTTYHYVYTNHFCAVVS
jgi:hypothetical protein